MEIAAKKGRRRSEKERRKPPRRHGSRALYYLLLLLFVTGAFAVLSVTVLFKVEEIGVTGVDRYEPDRLIAASGIRLGDNLLRIPATDVEAKLLADFPYLETVSVARRFPPRVEIIVTQCKPQAAVSGEGGTVSLITLDGKLLEKGRMTVPAGLPLVKGLETDGVSPGDLLGTEKERPENLEKLGMLRYLFEAAKATDFGPVTNVDVTDRLNMKMVHEARLVLELGSEADMEYKLTFLSEVMGRLGPEDEALLDATNARNKRILVKWGQVENGVFIPFDNTPDEVVTDGGTLSVEEGDQSSGHGGDPSTFEAAPVSP